MYVDVFGYCKLYSLYIAVRTVIVTTTYVKLVSVRVIDTFY